MMKIKKRKSMIALVGVLCINQVIVGCAKHQARPSITAVGLSPANRCEPHGIPYYLPKPLLVVAKNVRHVDESKVGLTGAVPIPGGFDNQAAYADIKANVTVPSSSGSEGAASAGLQAANIPAAVASTATLGTEGSKSMVGESMTPAANADFNDGLEVDSFFTYQIVFVPDLTQKYGLRISGGAGEVRAAMNLVNGWMYTGMGPYYFKDSSSAQNAMASGVAAMYAGRGVSDVVNSVGNLTSDLITAAKKESALTSEDVKNFDQQMRALNMMAQSTPKVPHTMLNYAEIYIYEPMLAGDQTEWRLVAEHHFDRQYFDNAADTATIENKKMILDFVLKSMASSNAQKKNEGAQTTANPQSKKIDVSISTPSGSLLRIEENGTVTSPQAMPAGRGAVQPAGSGSAPPAGGPVAPANPAGAIDRGPEVLELPQIPGPGSGTSSVTPIGTPTSLRGTPISGPQVDINVFADRETQKPTAQPTSPAFPRLHRVFHQETAKAIQVRGDTTLAATPQ